MKKVSEAHFQKVLKRQKSANSTKRCSNDNLKSAQTTIFYKTLYFNRKSFCNILGAEWHLLPLEMTKIMNSSLYEQKNHFSYPVSVADDANFSCHCAAESRHDLHLPLRSCSTCLGMAMTRNLPACWNVSKTTKPQFLTANCRYWLTATAIRWAVKPRTLPRPRSVPTE